MTILLQFLMLLAVHWVADFVCQTHWQASNKSKRLDALARHVGVYTAILSVASIILFGIEGAQFAAINGILHFATDYFTSRWSSKHFGKAMSDVFAVRDAARLYGENADLWVKEHAPTVDPGKHFHNFFVVIGLDQLIHQMTLAATLWLVI